MSIQAGTYSGIWLQGDHNADLNLAVTFSGFLCFGNSKWVE